jgi:cadmium resistance protein CadD (predicted permease)
MLITRILKDIHTCKNNEHFDYGKIVGSFCIIAITVLAVFDVYVGKNTINLTEIAGAYTLILTGLGLTQKLKKETEPGN